MQKNLNQYRDFLTPAQAAEGMNAAMANAKRLACDAELLLAHGRFATAASIAILAIEELGKTGILRGIARASTKSEVQAEWRQYRKHTAKNFLALMPDLVRNGARQMGDFIGMFTEERESERSQFDVVKQLGFYTDCCGAVHWSLPDQVIDEKLATSIVDWAITLTANKQRVTEQEIDLWAWHMRTGQTERNILTWCSAMVAADLMSPEHADGLCRFVESEKERRT